MKFPLVWGYPYPRSAIECCRSPAWCGALLLVLDPSRPPKQTRPRPQDRSRIAVPATAAGAEAVKIRS